MTKSVFVDRRGLYPIVDLDALGSNDPHAFLRDVLRAGDLFAVQLRAKSHRSDEVLSLARSLGAMCNEAGVPFVVNDRLDVAWLASASVHVGQEDLSVQEIQSLGLDVEVGVSTHDEMEWKAALAIKPSYVAIGPVYATRSKVNPGPTVSHACVRDLVASAGEIPVVAIGGITLETAAEMRSLGVRSIAVIGELTQAIASSRVTEVARALHAMWQ